MRLIANEELKAVVGGLAADGTLDSDGFTSSTWDSPGYISTDFGSYGAAASTSQVSTADINNGFQALGVAAGAGFATAAATGIGAAAGLTAAGIGGVAYATSSYNASPASVPVRNDSASVAYDPMGNAIYCP